MRNPTLLHFQLALFTAAFCAAFVFTSIADLKLRPIQPAQENIVLRLQVVPPGVAI